MRHIRFARFASGAGPAKRDVEFCAFDDLFPDRLLVSCLMVTRGNMNLIRASYDSFSSQSWKHKELIIVCDNVTEELRNLAASNPHEVRLVEAPPGNLLGDLRNLSVARCRGDFICQWDDDDLYDPNRIAISMRILSQASVDAVFLNSWLMWWEARRLLAVSPVSAWDGSMLARRSVVPIYPSLAKGEDNFVTNWICRNHPVALIEYPQLYLYRVTGENTWDEQHFERLFRSASRIFSTAELDEAFKLPCFAFANANRRG